MKKIFRRFIIAQFKKMMPKDVIIDLYREIAAGDLQIETREVTVKKGRKRYTLFIAKDGDAKTIFDLGRHFNSEPEVVIR